MVPILATILLMILLMSPEVTSQSNCYIKTNGCSVPFNLPFIYKKTFTPACVKHDVCYSCVRFSTSLLIRAIFIPIWSYLRRNIRRVLVEPWFLWQDQTGLKSKRTKKVLLGIYRTQIRPSEHHIVALSGQWLDIVGYQNSRHGLWLANCEFGYDKTL